VYYWSGLDLSVALFRKFFQLTWLQLVLFIHLLHKHCKVKLYGWTARQHLQLMMMMLVMKDELTLAWR